MSSRLVVSALQLCPYERPCASHAWLFSMHDVQRPAVSESAKTSVVFALQWSRIVLRFRSVAQTLNIRVDVQQSEEHCE